MLPLDEKTPNSLHRVDALRHSTGQPGYDQTALRDPAYAARHCSMERRAMAAAIADYFVHDERREEKERPQTLLSFTRAHCDAYL